jgi:hypothetical protein
MGSYIEAGKTYISGTIEAVKVLASSSFKLWSFPSFFRLPSDPTPQAFFCDSLALVLLCPWFPD